MDTLGFKRRFSSTRRAVLLFRVAQSGGVGSGLSDNQVRNERENKCEERQALSTLNDRNNVS